MKPVFASRHRSTFRRLLSSVLLCVVSSTASIAQSLPLEPVKVSLTSTQPAGKNAQWKIGPLSLEFPAGWHNTSANVIAQLSGPANSRAVFVMAQVTAEAKASGYSLLEGMGRSPRTFINSLQWDECTENPARKAVELTASRSVQAFYASCTVELRPGIPGRHVQAIFYGRSHVVQMHAIGTESAMSDLVATLESYRWHDAL